VPVGTFDVNEFLAERHRVASVATVTASGTPALATMWFLFDSRRFWFHSPSASRAFLDAAARGASVAVMVATWDPPLDVRQLRATGTARTDAHDPDRVERIYGRYLDGDRAAWRAAWAQQIESKDYHLWSVLAERGTAVSYENLQDGARVRWSDPGEVFR
jgi:Pyridoxamine 5'-phosphate oxidase